MLDPACRRGEMGEKREGGSFVCVCVCFSVSVPLRRDSSAIRIVVLSVPTLDLASFVHESGRGGGLGARSLQVAREESSNRVCV